MQDFKHCQSVCVPPGLCGDHGTASHAYSYMQDFKYCQSVHVPPGLCGDRDTASIWRGCRDCAVTAAVGRSGQCSSWQTEESAAHSRLPSPTHTHAFSGHSSGTTRVSRYQKGKTNLDFTEARDSEWQWHQLGHMQVCTSLQTDSHTSTPPLSFFAGRMPFLSPNQQCHSTECKYHHQCNHWKCHQTDIVKQTATLQVARGHITAVP